ncbi:MAG TPA: FAD-dependent oxidoreductase, partial [Oscillospiraceae bacterium]|nr:FAD-dependent oxidoreductase [Oscillospiraceae bacterium]
TQLLPTLEFMKIRGLYGAGQFNGSSGYEEAAAQGLLAGINAVAQITGKEPLILDRASSYIGTLVDDLVTKGCNDPYRMMTSRSEYRLTLRQDNAEERLTPIGYERGLISQERYNRYMESKMLLESELKRLWKLNIAPSKALNELLTEVGTAPISTGIKAAELIRRPQVTYDMLAPFDKDRTELSEKVKFQVEVLIKYEGYINKQSIQIEEMRRLENKALPKDFDYCAIKGLRIEAVEKLNRIAPLNIGQASRISGVSPADISVLLIWLAAQNPRRGN